MIDLSLQINKLRTVSRAHEHDVFVMFMRASELAAATHQQLACIRPEATHA
jgi:hypothetical protein